MPKPPLETTGWLEGDEKPKFAIPKRCPKCGKSTHITDASRLCGIIFVYCTNIDILTGKPCRWCEVIQAQGLYSWVRTSLPKE
jgi:hypothetical protein